MRERIPYSCEDEARAAPNLEKVLRSGEVPGQRPHDQAISGSEPEALLLEPLQYREELGVIAPARMPGDVNVRRTRARIAIGTERLYWTGPTTRRTGSLMSTQ